MMEEYGNVVRLWVALHPSVFVADAKWVEFLLTSTTHLKKADDYQFLAPWLGKGLLISPAGPTTPPNTLAHPQSTPI